MEGSTSARKQTKVGTDPMLASIITLRSVPVHTFLAERSSSPWPLSITSINEDKLLEAIGVNQNDRKAIEGLSKTARDATLSRPDNALAYDPPASVFKMQQLTSTWLLRPFPLGLRFSGSNMNPLPAWLAGGGHVALNMCNNDLGLQLHHALFNGSGGYVLKPAGMRGACVADEGVRWPQPRDRLRRTTIRVLSLHNLPKRGGGLYSPAAVERATSTPRS